MRSSYERVCRADFDGRRQRGLFLRSRHVMPGGVRVRWKRLLNSTCSVRSEASSAVMYRLSNRPVRTKVSSIRRVLLLPSGATANPL
jgi:hypothetical protein